MGVSMRGGSGTTSIRRDLDPRANDDADVLKNIQGRHPLSRLTRCIACAKSYTESLVSDGLQNARERRPAAQQ
jgi:hypothetical protein